MRGPGAKCFECKRRRAYTQARGERWRRKQNKSKVVGDSSERVRIETAAAAGHNLEFMIQFGRGVDDARVYYRFS